VVFHCTRQTERECRSRSLFGGMHIRREVRGPARMFLTDDISSEGRRVCSFPAKPLTRGLRSAAPAGPRASAPTEKDATLA
jgi:hypothetical protein